MTSGYLAFSLLSGLEPLQRWEDSWDEYELGDWGNKNPPLGKYFVGAIVSVVNDDGVPVRYGWTWPESLEWNMEYGNLPPPHLLTRVRVGMALFGSLALILAWLAAFIATRDPLLALVAPLYLYSVSTFRFRAWTVHMDSIQLVFLLAAAAALFAFMRVKSTPYAILAATAAGLSCAVKFSSGPMVLVIALAVAFQARGSAAHRAFLSFITLIVPVAVFVIVNPYLYDAPLDKTLDIIQSWSESKRDQMTDPAHVDNVVHSRLGATTWLIDELGGHHTTAAKISAVIATLCLWVWLRFGFRFQLSRRATIGLVAAVLLVLLLEWQINDHSRVISWLWPVAIFAIVYSHRSQTASEQAQNIAVCGAALFVTGWTALWLPFYWSQYALPPEALGSIVLALGATRLVELLRARFDPNWTVDDPT